MINLDNGYTVEIDSIDKDSWHSSLVMFSDASIYQTWSYGAIKWGEHNLSHVILKKNTIIVSMVQLRISRFPIFRYGIAYINWGPIWKKKDELINIAHLRNMVRALYNEYVLKRGYYLRILPKLFDENYRTEIFDIFRSENFSWSPDSVKTIVVDLSVPTEELRRNLSKGWKHSLNFALRQNLRFIEGSGDELSEILLKISREMKQRKKFIGDDQDTLITVNKDLPEYLKLKIVICMSENEAVAALGWPVIGSTGMVLVGGTGNKALKLKASVLLWWKMIEYYKTNSYLRCDLAGVNLRRNPGGYTFKKGLAGKNYKDTEHYIGRFDACGNYLICLLFKIGFVIRRVYRNVIIHRINNFINKLNFRRS